MAHLERPPIALGFSLDGADDYIRIPHKASIDLSTLDEFTVVVLFRPLAWADKYFCYLTYKDTRPRIRLTSYDGLSFEAYTVEAAYQAVRELIDRWDALGKWCLAGIGFRKGQGVQFMWNGEYTVWRDWPYTIEATTVEIRLGRFDAYYSAVQFAAFWIYNRVLSAGEISDLYSIRRNIMEGCVLKLGTLGLVRGGGTQWLDEGPYKLHGTVYGAKRVRCCHCNPVVNYGV